MNNANKFSVECGGLTMWTGLTWERAKEIADQGNRECSTSFPERWSVVNESWSADNHRQD